MTISWWQHWDGECVAIIGGGFSAKHAGVEKLKDRIHVVAINESFQLAPFADILYSAEAVWWSLRWKEVKKHPGLKLSYEAFQYIDNRIEIVRTKDTNKPWTFTLDFEKPGRVGSGGNSGFQMVNLVAQFGVAAIALIGFDLNFIGGVHWHKNHPPPLRNPTYDRFDEWRKALDDAAPVLAAKGIDVVNCSPTSSLTKYPKMSVDEMLERWGL